MNNQVFLAVVFCLAIAGGLSSSTFGRPLFPPSRIASKSAFVYIPAVPMYLQGFLSFLWSLLFTAADDIPSSCAISITVRRAVFPSIYISLAPFPVLNQGIKGKMSSLLDILLYNRIVNSEKFFNFFEFFAPTLDVALRLGYSFNI